MGQGRNFQSALCVVPVFGRLERLLSSEVPVVAVQIFDAVFALSHRQAFVFPGYDSPVAKSIQSPI